MPDHGSFGLKAVRFDFPGGAEVMLTLTDADGATKRAVGLDGVHRWSAGPNNVRFGITGRR